MQSIRLKAHVGHDGILTLALPQFSDVEVEIEVREVPEMANLMVDEQFFTRLDAIEADDVQERPASLPVEVRDEIE